MLRWTASVAVRVLGWTSSRGCQIWPRGRRISPPPRLLSLFPFSPYSLFLRASLSLSLSLSVQALPDVGVEPHRSLDGTDAGLSASVFSGARSTRNRRRRSQVRPPHDLARDPYLEPTRPTPILLSKKLVCHYLYKKVTSERGSQGKLVEVDLRSLEPFEFPGAEVWLMGRAGGINLGSGNCRRMEAVENIKLNGIS